MIARITVRRAIVVGCVAVALWFIGEPLRAEAIIGPPEIPAQAGQALIRQFELPEPLDVDAISHDGKTVACSNRINEVRFLDLETGGTSPVLLRAQWSKAVRFRPEAEGIIALGWQTAIYPLNGTRPKFTLTVPMSQREVFKNPDGTPDFTRPRGEFVGPGLATPAITSDGKLLFAHDKDSNIIGRELPSFNETRTFRGNKSPVSSIHVSPNDKVLVVWTEKEVMGYSIDNEKLLFRKDTPDVGENGVFLPDSKVMFCYGERHGAKDGSWWFQQLDVTTGTTRAFRRISTALLPIPAVVITKDGKHAMIPNPKSKEIHIFDTTTGEEVATSEIPHFPGMRLVLTPDGKHVIASNETKIILMITTEAIVKGKVFTAADFRPKR